MICRKKYFKEALSKREISALWLEAFSNAIDLLEDEGICEKEGSDSANIDVGQPFKGFISFNKILGDSLLLSCVYPQYKPLKDLINLDFIDVYDGDLYKLSDINSKEDKSEALKELDDYIEKLRDAKNKLEKYIDNDIFDDIDEAFQENQELDEWVILKPGNVQFADIKDINSEDENEIEIKDDIIASLSDAVEKAIKRYAEIIEQKIDNIIGDLMIDADYLQEDLDKKIDDALDLEDKINRIKF